MAIERRDFLRTTGKAITLGAATLALGGKILGANDRVRVAICGVRGRGNDHIHGFTRVPGTELAALCDVDESVLNQRLGDIEKLGLPKPKSYVDVRKLLEDKDIDAISIATPNHWHSLMAIWACQAGKDVYVEKPCSHNWFEGRQLVRAAKKYNRICQHGSQSPIGFLGERIVNIMTAQSGLDVTNGNLAVVCGKSRSKSGRGIPLY